MPELKLPTPHGDKLQALLSNNSLPEGDLPRVQEAIAYYQTWLTDLSRVEADTSDAIVAEMVELVNEYKFYIDVDLIFASEWDFLHRQKGQLKLDNTIIEEFLPWLIMVGLADKLEGKDLWIGPANCFSGLRFESELISEQQGGGMKVRSKDQDFAIGKKLFMLASHYADFREATTAETMLGYVTAECKTNLDKTMFQEAAATALDLKNAVPSAKYYLLCEWLDMTPITTTITAIDEVIILRKGRRLSADVRRSFSTANGRQAYRGHYEAHLRAFPLTASSFQRFVSHISRLVDDEYLDTAEVLDRGFF